MISSLTRTLIQRVVEMAFEKSPPDDAPVSPAVTASSRGSSNSNNYGHAVEWGSRPVTPDRASVSSTAATSPGPPATLSDAMNNAVDNLIRHTQDLFAATDVSGVIAAASYITRHLPNNFPPNAVETLVAQWIEFKANPPHTRAPVPPATPATPATPKTTAGPRRGCPICGTGFHNARRCWFLALPGTTPGSMMMPNMSPERLKRFANMNHPALPQGMVLVSAFTGQPTGQSSGESKEQSNGESNGESKG
ncbi:hypothetical protein QQZ08_002471 [Neonectria magnoliae]|uniref:Uncharacterized protein n=1 Tax=Neonectria magnoliae TaxID=2732573 RepID=A0ABR1IDB1_9HYPO